MINQILIEGVIQRGFQEKPAVEIRKTQSGKNIVSFTIISKYGPDSKFSSGLVKVQRWANDAELGMFEIMQFGDIVNVSGSLTFNSYEKDGKKIYIQLINADEVTLVRNEEELEKFKSTLDPMDSVPTANEYHSLKESEMPEGGIPF